MEYAYPVLEVQTEEGIRRLLDYLGTFENLRIAGRNACFTYTSIHEVLRSTRDALKRTAATAGRVPETGQRA